MNGILSVDFDLCTGCRSCETVCSLKHYGEGNPARARVKVLRYEKMGHYPILMPMVCQQCETPMCAAVCPAKSILKDGKSGAYVVDEKKCLGCRLCVAACPVGAIEVDPINKSSFKCDLCDGDPTCVKFCPQESIRLVTKEEIGWEQRKKAAERLSLRLQLATGGGR